MNGGDPGLTRLDVAALIVAGLAVLGMALVRRATRSSLSLVSGSLRSD